MIVRIALAAGLLMVGLPTVEAGEIAMAQGGATGVASIPPSALTSEELKTYMTASSIFLATALGMLGYIQRQRFERRKHSIAAIMSFTLSESLGKADQYMASAIRLDDRLSADISGDNDENVMKLLDYYEFLATTCYMKGIDKNVLRELRGGAMVGAYKVCQGYIEGRRERYGARLYARFEELAKEFGRD